MMCKKTNVSLKPRGFTTGSHISLLEVTAHLFGISGWSCHREPGQVFVHFGRLCLVDFSPTHLKNTRKSNRKLFNFRGENSKTIRVATTSKWVFLGRLDSTFGFLFGGGVLFSMGTSKNCSVTIVRGKNYRCPISLPISPKSCLIQKAKSRSANGPFNKKASNFVFPTK